MTTKEKIWEYLLKCQADFDNGHRSFGTPTRAEIALFLGYEGRDIGSGISLVSYHLDEMDKLGWIKIGRGHQNIKIKGK